jgi:hypothetical protein
LIHHRTAASTNQPKRSRRCTLSPTLHSPGTPTRHHGWSHVRYAAERPRETVLPTDINVNGQVNWALNGWRTAAAGTRTDRPCAGHIGWPYRRTREAESCRAIDIERLSAATVSSRGPTHYPRINGRARSCRTVRVWPGSRGPEPYCWCVLRCPSGSNRLLMNSNGPACVSFCALPITVRFRECVTRQ